MQIVALFTIFELQKINKFIETRAKESYQAVRIVHTITSDNQMRSDHNGVEATIKDSVIIGNRFRL